MGERKRKSSKQGLTSAKNLTIELPEGCDTPYHYFFILMLIDLIFCGIAFNPGPRGIMSIVACELEYTVKAIQSPYIPLPPVVQNYRVGQLGRR